MAVIFGGRPGQREPTKPRKKMEALGRGLWCPFALLSW